MKESHYFVTADRGDSSNELPGAMKNVLTKIRNAVAASKTPHGYRNAIALSNAASDDGKIKIVHFGDFPLHKDGPHSVTKEQGEEMVANAKAQTLDLLVDYGHKSAWESASPAAGWIKKESLEVRDDGVYSDPPDFTPKAKQMVRDKELQGLSAFYFIEYFDAYNKNQGARLWHIALTNVPYMETDVDHIPNFANSHHILGDEPMKFSNDFLKNLGYTDEEITAGNITDEDVEAKMNARLAATADPPETPTADTPEEPAADTAAANAQADGDPLAASPAFQKLTTAVEGLVTKDTQRHEAEIEAVVNSAVDERRILPRDKDAYLAMAKADPEGTKVKLNAMPKNSVLPTPVTVAVGVDGEAPQLTAKESFVAFANTQNLVNG